MWEAVKGLLASKKALMAFLALVIWAVGRFGADLDPDTLYPAVAPLWAYIFGQGIADHGKGKVEAEAKRDNAKRMPLPLPADGA